MRLAQRSTMRRVFAAFLILAVTLTIAVYYAQRSRDSLARKIDISTRKAAHVATKAAEVAKVAAETARVAKADCETQIVHAHALNHYINRILKSERILMPLRSPRERRAQEIRIKSETTYLHEMQPTGHVLCEVKHPK